MTEHELSERVPADPHSSMAGGTIVVGVDGSTSSQDVLRWDARQSRFLGQELHAVIASGYTVDIGAEGFGEYNRETHARDILQATLDQALRDADARTVHRQGLLHESVTRRVTQPV